MLGELKIAFHLRTFGMDDHSIPLYTDTYCRDKIDVNRHGGSADKRFEN